MNVEISSTALESGMSTTSLAVRNRAKMDDGFGLLRIGGWLIDADDGEITLEVKFGGQQKRLANDEAVLPLSTDGTRQVEFHLITHLVPDGTHQLDVAATTAGGRRVEFPPLIVRTENDSALGR